MHTADLQSAREGVARYCRRNPDANATAMQIIASFFPHQHAIPKNYFELSSKAAEAVDAHVERQVRAREFKVRAFSDFMDGHDMNALRIPRPDAGQYAQAYREQLLWIQILGADGTHRKAALDSLVTNLQMEINGFFIPEPEATQ